jgi:hypothetical protein
MPPHSYSALIAAVGITTLSLIVALAWNDFFQEWFRASFKNAHPHAAELLYAVGATLVAVLAIYGLQHMLPENVNVIQAMM